MTPEHATPTGNRAAVVPRQLPAPAASPRHLLPGTTLFTGRDREMGALLALAGQAGAGAWPGPW
jgi:hypothetical protein